MPTMTEITQPSGWFSAVRAVTFPVDQHGIADASLRVIQGHKIPLWRIARQGQRLHHQQFPIFVIRVTDRGNDRSNNFT